MLHLLPYMRIPSSFSIHPPFPLISLFSRCTAAGEVVEVVELFCAVCDVVIIPAGNPSNSDCPAQGHHRQHLRYHNTCGVLLQYLDWPHSFVLLLRILVCSMLHCPSHVCSLICKPLYTIGPQCITCFMCACAICMWYILFTTGKGRHRKGRL